MMNFRSRLQLFNNCFSLSFEDVNGIPSRKWTHYSKKTKRKDQNLKHLDKKTMILELFMQRVNKILIFLNLSLVPHARIGLGINNHS